MQEDNATLFVYPDGVEGPVGHKKAEIESYIHDVDMDDLVTVALDSFKGILAVTGPEDLLFELYNDCVYVGDEEGIEEGFEASISR